MTTTLPPHNLHAERALLGALLLPGNAFIDVEDIVGPDDFYAPPHQALFDVIVDLATSGTPIDAVTVARSLEQAGSTLADVGGVGALMDMQAETPAIGNAAHYARIVADAATARRMAAIGREITALGMSASDNVESAVDQAGRLVDELAAKQSGAALPPIAHVVDGYREHMDTPIDSVPTGYAGLDRLIGGWMKGHLNLVGAPSGAGKTSLLIASAAASCKAGRPVLFHTLEMSEGEIIDRVVAMTAGIPLDRLTKRSMTATQRDARNAALDEITSWPLFIDDSPQPTMAGMKSNARTIRRLYGEVGVCMFDYMQLYKPEERGADSRQVEVANASRNLKILARVCDMPVTVGIQLNNAATSRTDRRPHMQDLRESSAPYHDASVVVFVYRPGFYDPTGTDADNLTELIVRKNRNGPPGMVDIDWVPRYSTFIGRGEPVEQQPPRFQTFADASTNNDF